MVGKTKSPGRKARGIIGKSLGSLSALSNVSTPGPVADDNHHADDHGAGGVGEGRHANEGRERLSGDKGKLAVRAAGGRKGETGIPAC
jgi:hypothetical protein